MTAPTHIIPRDLLEGIRTGDEQTLEHGFREIFPALAKEAAEELDDSSSASRVVERAFLNVLAHGPAITNADSLDQALQKALHEGAMREKSRRASLHRFEQNEHVQTRRNPRLAVTEVETDRAWERIQRVRHPVAAPTTQTATAATVASKRRAAAHMAEAMNRRNKWTIPAIALGVIAVCAGAYGLSHIDSRPGEADIQRALASTDAQVLSAGNGQIGNVTLGDESIVKLGAASRLRISKDFGVSLRAVSLNGAASFAVAAAGPSFELRANGVALSLPAGKIDVRSDSLGSTLVRVNDGQVRVKTADSAWTATTGQAFVIETTGKARAAVPAELEESLGWITGQFTASGSVAEVVAKMNRWYGSDVGIGDASIADRPAEVTGSLSSLPTTLKSLEKSANVQMVWEKGRMILFRKG